MSNLNLNKGKHLTIEDRSAVAKTIKGGAEYNT